MEWELETSRGAGPAIDAVFALAGVEERRHGSHPHTLAPVRSSDPNPPIRIIVKNSRVTLEGVVDSEGDKNLCTLRVNQISSVLSVTNNLRVVK